MMHSNHSPPLEAASTRMPSPVALDIDAILKRNYELEIEVRTLREAIAPAYRRAEQADRALRSGIERHNKEKDRVIKELRAQLEAARHV